MNIPFSSFQFSAFRRQYLDPIVNALRDRIIRWGRKLETQSVSFMILLGVAVGVSVGYTAIFYEKLIDFFEFLFFDLLAGGLQIYQGYIFLLPLIPIFGNLIVSWIIGRFAPENHGHSVPEIMLAVAKKGGILSARVGLLKGLSTAIAIGSGVSVGREGPIVSIGATIGSNVGQMLKMSSNGLKVMVGCGAAAGISAMFNAPLAGVVYAIEIVLGRFTINSFSPVIVSSVLAAAISRAYLGNFPAFNIPMYELVSHWELIFYSILGIIAGGVSVFFIRTLYWVDDQFQRMIATREAKAILGGLILGVVGIFFPQIFGVGYDTTNDVLFNRMELKLMLILLLLKPVMTSVSLGSGSTGGIFAPSLFIGAMLGGAFGMILNVLFPAVTANPGAYALVGMTAVVAGTTHGPMTAIITLFEMTNSYQIILPLMIAGILSTIVSRQLHSESIYTEKLLRRGVRIQQGSDISILERIQLRDIMQTEFKVFQDDEPVANILHYVEEHRSDNFPVVDAAGKFAGMISFQELRDVFLRKELHQFLIASDIAVRDTITLSPQLSLLEALYAFEIRNQEVLPVVGEQDASQVVGLVSRSDIMSRYRQELLLEAKQIEPLA
ncbi:MAG: chloride channel protein [Gemmatimonadetes bacterium]|nr:MAG: chloride channel protein [Gemmatimonadota bacterium]